MTVDHCCTQGTVAVLLEQRCTTMRTKVVGTYCCVTVISAHINATMTYVVLHEEHPWNVSVLHSVHVPFLL